MTQNIIRIYTTSGWQDLTVPGGGVPADGGALVCTYATRPLATDSAGRLVLVTDEPDAPAKLQYSDGAAWYVVADGMAASSAAPVFTTLTYASNGDANGVIYWLGTRAGAFAPPVPDTAQAASAVGTHLRIDVTSTYPDSAFKIVNAVNRGANNQCWEDNATTPTGWFRLDFLARKLKPNRYSLRAREDAPVYYIRNWVLEGSNNAADWMVLDNRINDTTINAQGAWGTFTCLADTYYRYIRVRQTGLNGGPPSANPTLVIGEIELYGSLRT